ncbi:OmpL47-type beta-barrel domain-containing protein [Paenibacillus hemerocallicola]|nr:cadherin-like beta sandwich domain-containing protein [Paenibacillus hemerocallicola]
MWHKTTDENQKEWLVLDSVGKASATGVYNDPFSLSDMVLELKVKPEAIKNWARYEIYFGYQDKNNTYYLSLHSGTGALNLYKKINGGYTALRTAVVPKPAIGTTVDYRIAAKNGFIQVYVDEAEVISVTDTKYTSGKVGVSVAGYYDNSSWTLAVADIRITDSNDNVIADHLLSGDLSNWTFDVPKWDPNKLNEAFIYTDGWEVPEDADGWESNAAALGAGYKAEVFGQRLHIESAGTGQNVFYLKKFLSSPYQNTKVLIRYKLDIQSTMGTSDAFPAIIDSSAEENPVSQLKLSPSGQVELLGDGTTTPLPFFLESGKEYFIGMVIDLMDAKQDIYVGNDDGTSIVVSGQPLTYSAQQIEGIVFHFDGPGNDTASSMFLDDLTIEEYSTEAMASFQQLLTQNELNKIDYLDDLQANVPNGIIFSNHSSAVYVDGTRVRLDSDDDTILPVKQGSEVLVPEQFVIQYLGNPSVPTLQINGMEYVSLQAVAVALDKKLWSNGNLIAVSDIEPLFTSADAQLVQRLERTFGVYISQQGSDANPGTYDAPFQTFEAARNYLRALKSDKGLPVGGITVYAMGGDYRFNGTFTLQASDSGRASAPITFRAYPGQQVNLSGAESIPSQTFSAVTDPATRNRLKDGVADKILQADLKTLGIVDYGKIQRTNPNTSMNPDNPALYIDGVKQTIARWPNAGFALTGDVQESGASIRGATWQYSASDPNEWTLADQLWVEGFWFWDWYSDSMQVDRIDTESRTITVKETTPYGVASGKRYYVFNLLEEIDLPGEWFLDRNTGLLYVYPTDDLSNKKIQFSTLNVPLINIENSENVTLTGMTFEETNQTALSVTSANQVRITGNTFRNIGGAAIRMTGGLDNRITDNDFYNLGKGGVIVSGAGYRPTLAPAHHTIANNYFTRYSIVSRTSAPAVSARGVGITVSNNAISEAPHLAISIDGNDNIVENNEIFAVVKETRDAGAIYSGRNYTNQGNMIRNNVIHDVYGDEKQGAHAIYMDDALSGTTIKSNVFFNLNRAVFIHGGRDHVVDSNLIAKSKESIGIVNLSGGGGSALLGPSGTLRTTYMEMPVSSDLWKARFPTLENLFSDEPHLPKYNTITNNLFYQTNDFTVPATALPTGVFSGNTQITDATLFQDAEHNDFRLTRNSGIPGFVPPDFGQMGLKLNSLRTAMPPIQDFKLTYPGNESSDIPGYGTVLAWEPAIGANRYVVTVATDEQLTDLVFQGEADHNRIAVNTLEYGGYDYFWKVEAISDSLLNPDVRINHGGVSSFRTAMTEEANKYELQNTIDEAKSLVLGANIGSNSGQYPAEAMDEFEYEILIAENIANDTEVSQEQVDIALAGLKQGMKMFRSRQVQGIVDLGELLKEGSNWVAADPNYISVSPSHVLTFAPPSGSITAGYKSKISNHAIWSFRAGFDFSQNAWQGFTLRAKSTSTVPWSTTSYLFVVKSNQFELQRFGPSGSFSEGVITIPNTIIDSGTEHRVQFGTLDTEDGVRILVKIDGNTIFDYLDQVGSIPEEGQFGIVSVYPAVLTIKPDGRSVNADLSALEISDIELDFDPDQINYEATVGSQVYTLTVIPTLDDGTASIVVKRNGAEMSGNGGSYPISLTPMAGEPDQIEIVVTSEIGWQKTYTVYVNRDDEAPTTEVLLSPAVPDGMNGWYVNPVTLSLSAGDNKPGVVQSVYSLDHGATWQVYTHPLTFSQSGSYAVDYRSTDHAGNVEAANTVSFRIDRTPPTATVAYSYPNDGSDFPVVATLVPDEAVTVTNNGGLSQYTFLANGSKSFEFVDDAGNPGTATATVNTIALKSNGVPGKPVLSEDNVNGTGIADGNYAVKMDMWWGNNGSLYKLYENEVLVDTRIFADHSPDAQSAVTSMVYKQNGTYRYYAELINAFGTTGSDVLTVVVAQATPAKPVLSHNNWDGRRSFDVSMNMWWGTNGTTYNLYENGVRIDNQVFADDSPNAQTAVTMLRDRKPGTYLYRGELVNYAGIASSDVMAVQVQ